MGVVLSGDGSQGKMQEELSPQSQSDPVVGSADLQTQSCRNLGIPVGDRETDRASLLQVAPGEVKVPGLDGLGGQGSGCHGHISTGNPSPTVYSPRCI